MTTPLTLGPELEAELAKQQAIALAARLKRFQPRTLCWLGLLPEWTLELADELGLAGDHKSSELVGELDRARLIERREVLGADNRLHETFWVRAVAREQLQTYLADAQMPVEQELDALASAVQKRGVVDPGMNDWLRVVQHHRRDPSGQSLMTEVDRLIGQGQLPEAATLVATARTVGNMLTGPLADGARRALWRLDRAHRNAEDQRLLQYYAARPRIEAALDELLAPDTSHWALHLLGAGGVGKTMLVRYLASGLYASAKEGRVSGFPVARADFDNLDPRFPQERPAELFRALAGEIVGYATTRGFDYATRRFQDAADALNEEMARTEIDVGRRLSLRNDMVSSFASLLSQLPRPVVLIMDTCEELAKLYALGAPAPAIDEMFAMLDKLHDAYPPLRVVLAGRRHLVPDADHGHDWAGPRLQERPFVRVVSVEGFTEDEAENYLRKRDKTNTSAVSASRLRPDMRSALLSRAVEGTDDDRSYNPFELACYCEWALKDPELDPIELRDAPGDLYVERRILGRLGDGPERHGLGVAAELGRFDLELAAAAWSRVGVSPTAAFDGIAAQEWVNVLSVNPDGRPRVIEIDQHLRDRIRRATAANPTRYPVDRSQLGRDAVAVIARQPLGELPAESVEAAVRLLPVEEAAALWRSVEHKIITEAAWAWAAQVIPRIKATEIQRVEAGGESILAAVLATQAAQHIHDGTGADIAAQWRDVVAAGDRHPENGRTTLLARAALGRIAAGEHGVRLSDHSEAILSHDFPVGSIMAAIDGALASGRSLATLGPFSLIDAARANPEADDDAVVPAILALARSQDAWQSGAPGAVPDADLAMALAEQATPADRWADWVPPRRLIDRCRVNRLAIAFERGEELGDVPWSLWRREALSRLGEPDAQRLTSLSLQFELGHRQVASTELASIEHAEQQQTGPAELGNIRPVVRPLAVSLADAWSVLGDPEQARGTLTLRRERAVAVGTEPDVIDACDLALLRLCRRYRTDAYFPSVQRLALEGTPAQRAEAWLVLALSHGKRPANPREAGSWHGWWQCQDRQSLDAVGSPDGNFEPPREEPGISPHVSEQDAIEFARLFRNADTREGGQPDGEELGSAAGRPAPTTVTVGAQGAVGRSSLAADEVYALRFPHEGAARLEAAAVVLRKGGDDLGAAQALLLAGLCAARVDDRDVAESAWQAFHDVAVDLDRFTPWRTRRQVVEAYLAGTPAAKLGEEASPEIDLRPISAIQPPMMRLPVDPSLADFAGSVGDPSPAPLAAAHVEPPQRPSVRRAVRRVLLALIVLLGIDVFSGAAIDAGSTVLAVIGTVFFVVFSAVIVLILPVAMVAVWRARRIRGRRVGAASRLVARRAGADSLRLTAMSHRGVSDLNASSSTSLGARLLYRNEDRSQIWQQLETGLDWVPAAINMRREQIPQAQSHRQLTLVQLDIDRELATLPWELWVREALPESAQAATVLFRSAGNSPTRRVSPPAATIFRGPRHLAPPASGRQGVAHLVGTPVRTSAGWRLRVLDATGSASESATRGRAQGEDLIVVEDIDLASRTLVVLQAEPVDESAQQLDGLREGFVGLARAALDSGAPAVLVLPPLPDEQAAAAVRTVWQAVSARRRRTSPAALVWLLAELQKSSKSTQPLDALLFLNP
jgi:hypothetical protein